MLIPLTRPSVLRYLAFERSEGDDGVVTFDAEAAVRLDATAADGGALREVMDEVDTVLAWAHGCFPGAHGPLDDGHAWDHAVQLQHEGPSASGGWATVALTLCGTPAFAEAFAQAFAMDDADG